MQTTLASSWSWSGLLGSPDEVRDFFAHRNRPMELTLSCLAHFVVTRNIAYWEAATRTSNGLDLAFLLSFAKSDELIDAIQATGKNVFLSVMGTKASPNGNPVSKPFVMDLGDALMHVGSMLLRRNTGVFECREEYAQAQEWARGAAETLNGVLHEGLHPPPCYVVPDVFVHARAIMEEFCANCRR